MTVKRSGYQNRSQLVILRKVHLGVGQSKPPLQRECVVEFVIKKNKGVFYVKDIH